MLLDWDKDALAEGLACYRRQQFFEAHEHWEDVWMRAAGTDRIFLQALIQITVAFCHLQRGNTVGAASLLGRALRKLNSFPAEYGGLAVEPLRTNLRTWIEALTRNAIAPDLPYPQIR
jgi:predicted metal-dependent hydrolase